MWQIKIEFETINQAGDFINKIRNIYKVEYHIDKKQILLNGENEYSKELVLQHLAEQIVNTYKTNYFNRNINLAFLPKEHKDTLVKALVLFDIESDIYFVLSYIEKYSAINIQSFNYFILSKIKHKWHEFALVTNMNGNYLVNYDVFIEFLKFLIGAIQPKNNVITLKSDLTKFLVFDDKENLITSKVDLKDEMGLITNLVLLAPQCINIYCVDKMSDKTFKTLYYLFDKKINLRV